MKRGSPGSGRCGMSSRKSLLILGAGRQAIAYREVFDGHPRYAFAGFVQDVGDAGPGATLEGLPILGLQEALALRETHAAVCFIGSPQRKRLIGKFEDAGFEFATLISSSADVARTAQIAAGCVVSHFASVGAHARIGRHSIVMRYTDAPHNVEIGECSTVCAGVMLGGGVRIGDGCFIGLGSVIMDGLTIGNGATVGAGAVVIRDVAEGATVVGNPARMLDGPVKG